MLRHQGEETDLILLRARDREAWCVVQPALLSSPDRVKTSVLTVALCILVVERMINKELSTKVKNLHALTK